MPRRPRAPPGAERPTNGGAPRTFGDPPAAGRIRPAAGATAVETRERRRYVECVRTFRIAHTPRPGALLALATLIGATVLGCTLGRAVERKAEGEAEARAALEGVRFDDEASIDRVVAIRKSPRG